MPSQGGMATSTPKALRKGHLAAPQQQLRGKATHHQLLHPYNHSTRAVIFITIITLTSSFYVPFSAEIPADVPSRVYIFLGSSRRKKTLPPVFQGKKRDVPENIISAKNSWDKILLYLPRGQGRSCQKHLAGFGCKRLKFRAKLSPGWHNLQPRTLQTGSSLGWHHHSRAGLERGPWSLLLSSNDPEPNEPQSAGGHKPDDYTWSWTPCEAAARP